MTAGRDPCDRPSDVTLMLRVRWDDEGAFAELYQRYYRKLANFFYGMSRDPHTAVDLCQETFFRVWQLRKRYRATGSFPAYLFSFARYVWLEKCRELKQRQRLGVREPWDESRALATANRAGRPDAAASFSEISEHIFAALDELPEEQRMVFIMRVIEGLAIDDIASIMQCPANTVRSRKILAIRKLREALKGLLVL